MGLEGPQGAQDCCPIELDLSDILDLCQDMPAPLLVTGILVHWMRNHFSVRENIENALLQDKVWTSDIKTTKIVIDSVFKWSPATTEARPGIFIKRGPWKVLRYGIDDRKLFGRVEPNRCLQQYNTMIQGSSTVFCVSGESAEAELLAWEVARDLIMFAPTVRPDFNFMRLLVSDIGDVNILEESKEHFVVPITVSYGLQIMWQICPPGVQVLR